MKVVRIVAAAAVTALATLALVAPASADVPRYQTQTATLTANVLSGAYIHTYTITISPCDNSFTGTGGIAALGLTEQVAGTLDGSTIDFQSIYTTMSPYAWSYSGPLAGGTGHGPAGQTFPVAFTLNVTGVSDWKNHGQYVKETGGGSDAAHSCVGMPMHLAWSTHGDVAPTLTGTNVFLPVPGMYRIDVSGTWTNTPHGLVDAEYDNGDHGSDWTNPSFTQDGWPGIGNDWGDLTIGGQFVDWGAYNAAHTYSYTGTFFGMTNLALAVFDGTSGGPVPAWYGDNTGALHYAITYLGG